MKIYHWVYIVLILSISILQMVTTLFTTADDVVSQFLPLLVATILTAATFGKMTQQGLLWRWFWLVAFWLLLAGEISLLALTAYLVWQIGISAAIQVTLLLLSIAMAVPGLIALYQYVYRSKNIWLQDGQGQ